MSNNHRSLSSSSPQTALGKCFEELGLPSALLSAVMVNYQSCDSHLVVIDNSSLMEARDGHVGRKGSDGSTKRVDKLTRWEELQEAMSFDCKLASKCWIPTKFWLLNEPSGVMAGNSKTFSLCWTKPEDVVDEMNHIKLMMKNATLDQPKCELGKRISQVTKIIEKQAPRLLECDKKITVVFYTQGIPTNSKGQTGPTIRQDFRRQLWTLIKLPVKIIVRLCTDDEKAMAMFNAMDSRFDSIDVLDDYWGEAMEVYLHNPWLTYSKGLHRLRESGLAPDILGDLDERPLTLDEVHQLCILLFIGDDTSIHLPLAPYQPTSIRQLRRASWVQNWFPFITALEGLVKKEELQWNPIKKKMMPWIDLDKLESSLKDQTAFPYHYERSASQPKISQTSQQAASRHNVRQTSNGNSESFQRSSSRPNVGQTSNGNSSRGRDPEGDIPAQPRNRRQFRLAQSMPILERETTTFGKNELTLEETIRRWSHKKPDYKTSNSLQHLLVTLPQTFPPRNDMVEDHEYFAKWKKLDKECFTDMGGDELKSLLQRALRKAKFFLHPDKLPKDLTENQSLLFKTIWDVITQQELAIFG